MNYYNYFTEIEETFVRRRGKHLFLSPLDWALIDGWKERGIPLHIVIRSIESVFDVYERQPVGTRSVKTLFYCREEIESQYNEWLKSQVGRSNDDAAVGTAAFSPDDILAHITGSIEKLKAVTYPELNEGITRVIERLGELRNELSSDVETIDKTLGDIEKLLDRSLLANWDRENMKTLASEIAGQLRAYKAEMEKDAYKSTYDLMLLKRLREEAGIPRLSLFYL